ncbi:unnamed protein product [Clavelina lepadiformis]|uniref:PRKCA-binding protein n=1 Tax=Clavelina lepadiformis TaxID=159417 RepID=A0ABP0GYR8_CLALP
MEDWGIEEDKMGMTTMSGTVTLTKDSQNLIGISIGGGAPLCPCLYIVQVFDNTPASKDGSLAAGDEIITINGQSVKGLTKVQLAKTIQAIKGDVKINYNKLHADPKQGKTLDIILKKLKHRLQDMERTATIYRGLMCYCKKLLKAYFNLCKTHREFGDIFSVIGIREPHKNSSLAFSKFSDAHRDFEKSGFKLLKTLKPMLTDLNTYLNKAIPDTKLTIKKYADVKFEYLSYCLKVKEMDDEEYSYAALQEPLYRVETGNYEYRLVLRCRQEARSYFAKLRKDVMEKLELLDNKHVQDIVFQLQKFVSAVSEYHAACHDQMKGADVFPIEVDLATSTFEYDKKEKFNDPEYEEDIENKW